MGPIPTIRVVTAVIARDGKYLITQRRPTAALPLLWEFPGGRVEDGESDADALTRVLLHRLGVEVEMGTLIKRKPHPYESYVVDLYVYDCRIVSGDPARLAVNDFRWVKSDEFDFYTFTPADESSVAQLLGIVPDAAAGKRRPQSS
ncbi:MAG: (deoxy)nucleoside triphosphate pyrophosphohydrolase [Deltaproteobacteria bacterium]|nr:(deoxy)nucleoside triphosphate pyrophosphohydrolase [Deltaproteobacteria bacterium]